MKKSLFVTVLTVLTCVVVFVVVSCHNNTNRPYEGFAFGIDVSQYNGNIDWSKVRTQDKTRDQIRFVIIRSTVGVDRDSRYEYNYTTAKENGFIVGSYHYYRPNENSSLQFENFKKTIHLEKGDILPVVDIEAASTVQSMASLKVGLRNFVNLVEKEYGVKPIIYTKLSMWRDYLVDDFSDCKLWVAAYSTSRRTSEIVKNADIHQFTQEIRDIPGIPEKFTDGDDIPNLANVLYR